MKLADKLHAEVRRRHLLSHREMAKLDAKQTAAREASQRRKPGGTGALTRAQETELAWFFRYAEGDVAKLRSSLGSALDRGRDRIPRQTSRSERETTEEHRERTATASRIASALGRIDAAHANVLLRFYGPGEYASLAAWGKWAPLIDAVRVRPRGEKVRSVHVSETQREEILANPRISDEIKRTYVNSWSVLVPVETGAELFTREEIHKPLNALARRVTPRGRVLDDFCGDVIELNRAIMRAFGHGPDAKADAAEAARLEAIMDQRQHDEHVHAAQKLLCEAERAYALARGDVAAPRRKRKPKPAPTREYLLRLTKAAQLLNRDVDTVRAWFDAGRLGEKRYVGSQRRIVLPVPASATDDEIKKALDQALRQP